MLARAEGAGTQDALVGALFVAAIFGTSPYWIEDFLGYLAFRAALYTAVFWVPVVVLALVVFYAFRILADRPWRVEAVSSDSPWTATRWQVRGWRGVGVSRVRSPPRSKAADEPLPAADDGVPETIVAGMS